MVALALFIRLDGTGYERRVPNPDDVAAVSVSRWYRTNDVLIRGEEGTNYWRSGNNWSLSWDYIEHRRSLGLPVFTDEIINEIKIRTPDYFESPEAIRAAVDLHQSIIGDKASLEGSRWGRSTWTYYLTYKMNDGREINREYTLSFSETPLLESAASLLKVFNQPEAVNKRNRFLTLPDSALRGAAVSISRGADYYEYDYYSPYMSVPRPSRMAQEYTIVTDDDLFIIMDAVRRDAAAGNIGYVNLHDLPVPVYPSYYYDSYRGSPTTALIELIYSEYAARVPPAFASDSIYEDIFSDIYVEIYEEARVISGLKLTLVINENCIHTMAAFRELLFTE